MQVEKMYHIELTEKEASKIMVLTEILYGCWGKNDNLETMLNKSMYKSIYDINQLLEASQELHDNIKTLMK